MRLTFRLCILAAVLLAPSIAAADDSGWYLGADLGRTTASVAPGGLGYANSFAMIFPFGDPAYRAASTSSLSSTSKKVEGGYWINDYVGWQVGYLNLGTYSNAFYARDPHNNICYGDCSISATSYFSDTNKVKVSGITMALTGRVPLPGEFELLGRVGWLAGSADYHERVTGLRKFGSDSSDSSDYSAWDLGLGLGWRFTSHWGVEMWWDVYKNTAQQYYGNSSFVADKVFDVRGVSLGVQYHF